MSESTAAKRIIKRYERLRSARSAWDAHWREAYKWTMPDGPSFTMDRGKGKEERLHITDNTAALALRNFVSGLMSHISSESAKWFSLATDDEYVNERPEMAAWLESSTEILLSALSDPRSQFYTKIQQAYQHLGTGGNACLQAELGKPDEGLLFFRMHDVQSYYLATDERGVVDTVYRVLKYTARQVMQGFGEGALSENMRESLKLEDDKQFTIVHAVEANNNHDPSRLHKSRKKFSSVYVDVEEERVIESGGFDEFPYAVGRWRLGDGEAYGRSPAMDALPTIRRLNAQELTLQRAAEKVVNPALMVPNDGFLGGLDMSPGGINVFEMGLSPDNRIQPIQTGAERGIPVTDQMIERGREDIRAAFYSDLFLFLNSESRPASITAFEINAQNNSRLQLLSDAVSRIQSELLGTIVTQSFQLLVKSGAIEPAPEIGAGTQLKVGYNSPYSRLQKMKGAEGIMQLAQQVAEFAQVQPEIIDMYDGDAATRFLREALGAPSTVLRGQDEVADIRSNRAEAQQAAQQAEAAERMVASASQASQAGLIQGAAGA